MMFSAGVTGLIEKNGRVAGVQAKRQGETIEVRAGVVIATDGRFSKLRSMAGFKGLDQSPVMDVAWLRIPFEAGDAENKGAFYTGNGRICILLARPGEWQIGYVFPKGDFNAIRAQGIGALQSDVSAIVPWLADRMGNITEFSQVHLLSVKADRLDRWYKDGLLFIGDAAHTMSPIGGIGINYAINDAVETANVLLPEFERGEPVRELCLQEIQHRRENPTAKIQKMQSFMQNNLVSLAKRHTPSHGGSRDLKSLY